MTLSLLQKESRRPGCYLIIGNGPSLLRHSDAIQSYLEDHGAIGIACNRSIELVRAKYWVWVDRTHYERSKWHENAKRAIKVGNEALSGAYDTFAHQFRPVPYLSNSPTELYLAGGTLTIAAHYAIRLGARQLIFVGCDSWTPDRDRYHAWDAGPLNEELQWLHRAHLERTALGVRALAEAHPGVEFFDATICRQHLGLPTFQLPSIHGDERMPAKPKSHSPEPLPRDPSVPSGYGKLVAVTQLGPKDATMWFEDASGTVRVVRMGCDTTNGLALEMKGQAQVLRI